MFLAIGHELAFGLRRAEMAQARWDWLKTAAAGYPVLDAEAIVKNGSGTMAGLAPAASSAASPTSRPTA